MKQTIYYFLAFLPLICFSNLRAQNQIELVIDQNTRIIESDTFNIITVNNVFPSPTLHLKKAKTYKVTVTNKLKSPTSIYWAGLLLPARESGNPFTNSLLIPAGASNVYTITPEQAGTFAYYANNLSQKQKGLYGGIVVSSSMDSKDYEQELTVVLSDLSAEDTKETMQTLKRNSNWFSIKKRVNQKTAYHYIKKGILLDRIKQSLKRIPAVGFNEVNQSKVLINGESFTTLSGCEKDSKIKLRVINAASASNFDLKFSGGEMTLLAADGLPVDTQSVDRIKIGIGETYDVSLTIPSDSLAYELRAQNFDGNLKSSIYFGDSSLIYGDSSLIEVLEIPVQDIYSTSGLKGIAWENELEIYKKADTTGMNKLQQMAAVRDQFNTASQAGNIDSILREQDLVLNYHMIKSPDSTQIDTNKPERVIEIKLQGNMQRYVWDISSKQMNDQGQIIIEQGERVTLVIENKTPFYQPLHFHGHYFRMTNAKGKYSPYKHTINIKPLDKVTLEFEANKEKAWALDGTMMYRKQANLETELLYNGTTKDSDVAAEAKNEKSRFNGERYNFGQASLMYNMFDFNYNSNTHKTGINIDFESDYRFYFETDIDYSYYMGSSQYMSVFGGLFMNGGDNRTYVIDSNNVTAGFKAFPKGVIGLRYTLPLFINAEARITHELDYRLEFSGRIPLAPRIDFRYRANTDKEYQFMLEGRIIKRASLMFSYDYLYGFGMGAKWRF